MVIVKIPATNASPTLLLYWTEYPIFLQEGIRGGVSTCHIVEKDGIKANILVSTSQILVHREIIKKIDHEQFKIYVNHFY